MTISRDENQAVVFTCSTCDETFTADDPNFINSWNLARTDGWITRKISNQWQHYCPNCGEGFR